jgi:signal transduction histidine kinase/CheY-like chemotaxis protein
VEMKKVLIVDDMKEHCDHLVQEMNRQGMRAVGVLSGEEAVALLAKNPHAFQFAVVDHLLSRGNNRMDGIEATRKMIDLNNGLNVLVFTAVPSDDIETIARFKYKALSAGAIRYLERGSGNQAPKQIHDFVAEIEQLNQLRVWIQDFYETRAVTLPSLLTQLDIGVAIIDRSYKVWYLNNRMRQIVGLKRDETPACPCSAWRGYCFSPCSSCLVTQTINDGLRHDGCFLYELPSRERDRLFYLHVWTQPICDDKGNILYASDKRPIAVMESIQDLTDSIQWKDMPLSEKMQIVAKAIHDCPMPGRSIEVRYFEKVRIFIQSIRNPSTFILQGAAGFQPGLQLNVPVDIYATPHMKIAEINMQQSGFGYFFSEGGGSDPFSSISNRIRFIYWPIIHDGRTMALIEVAGDKCNADAVSMLRPYAKEVSDAINMAKPSNRAIVKSQEAKLAEVDLKLQNVKSTIDALRLLVLECCKLTNSNNPIVRYREQDEAVLLDLGIPAYEHASKHRHPLSNVESWSVRTIVSGQAHILNISEHSSEIMHSRALHTDECRQAIMNSRSQCFLPLLVEGNCIGSLGLHSEDQDNYSQDKIIMARSIATRVALVLHDFLVELGAKKRVEEVQNETLRLILHNINNPLGTLRTEVQRAINKIAKNAPQLDELASHLQEVERQAQRIARIRGEYLKLQKPWESRIVQTDLHRILEVAVSELIGSDKDISIEFNLNHELRNIWTDCSALQVCLGVLLQNSIDALGPMRNNKKINVSLRPALTSEENIVHSERVLYAIDIADNGPGINEQSAKDLFRIIRSRKASGLGFGLSYCRHVARLAGGEVYFHEEIENGAVFTLIMPFMKEQRSQIFYGKSGSENESSSN